MNTIFIFMCATFAVPTYARYTRSSQNFNESVKISPKIYGGNPEQITNVPYLGALMYEEEFICSVTLLCESWALTTAECIFYVGNKPWSKFLVMLGTQSWALPQEATRQIKRVKIITHPEFNKVTNENNLALLQLESTASFNDVVQPINLPRACDRSNNFVGTVGTIAGWGETDDAIPGPVTELHSTKIPVLSFEVCTSYNIPMNQNKSMCAGDLQTTNACYYDAGSPLVIETNSLSDCGSSSSSSSDDSEHSDSDKSKCHHGSSSSSFDQSDFRKIKCRFNKNKGIICRGLGSHDSSDSKSSQDSKSSHSESSKDSSNSKSSHHDSSNSYPTKCNGCKSHYTMISMMSMPSSLATCSNEPSIHMRITSYLPWITSHTGIKLCE